MNNSESSPLFDDSVPFVNEACGDTMWDDVLNQPMYLIKQQTPLPPSTSETTQQEEQLAEDTGIIKIPNALV